MVDNYVDNYVREVRCYRCNILGHISSTCRVDVKEITSINGSKGIVDNHRLNGECVRKVGYIEESKIECYIVTSSQVSIIPFSFLNKIDNINMGKPSPCLKIIVENCKNIKYSNEGKIMSVRKWISPDTVKPLY